MARWTDTNDVPLMVFTALAWALVAVVAGGLLRLGWVAVRALGA